MLDIFFHLVPFLLRLLGTRDFFFFFFLNQVREDDELVAREIAFSRDRIIFAGKANLSLSPLK